MGLISLSMKSFKKGVPFVRSKFHEVDFLFFVLKKRRAFDPTLRPYGRAPTVHLSQVSLLSDMNCSLGIQSEEPCDWSRSPMKEGLSEHPSRSDLLSHLNHQFPEVVFCTRLC